jgi:hypothetical protein
MRVFTFLLGLLLSLGGCASQGELAPDFFAGQAGFSAARERERYTFSAIDYDSLFAHVIGVLLDLDCTLQASDMEHGVISARGSFRNYRDGLNRAPYVWTGCAGHSVTVVLSERSNGEIEVRASFFPPDPRADQTFAQLLNNSVALAEQR